MAAADLVGGRGHVVVEAREQHLRHLHRSPVKPGTDLARIRAHATFVWCKREREGARARG
eukprot:715060-Rhodomonas_salina.1